MKAIPLVALLFALASAASAKESTYHQNVNAGNGDTFQQVVTWVHDEMKTGGRYAEVTPAERLKVDARFAEMQALFDERGSIERMHQDEKVALFNAQEEVNALLAKRDTVLAERDGTTATPTARRVAQVNREKDRVICENRAAVGSHIAKTTCHTKAQSDEAQRDTQRIVKAWDNRACAGGTVGRPCMPGKPGGASGL